RVIVRNASRGRGRPLKSERNLVDALARDILAIEIDRTGGLIGSAQQFVKVIPHGMSGGHANLATLGWSGRAQTLALENLQDLVAESVGSLLRLDDRYQEILQVAIRVGGRIAVQDPKRFWLRRGGDALGRAKEEILVLNGVLVVSLPFGQLE